MRNSSTSLPSPQLPTSWPLESWKPLGTFLTLLGIAVVMFGTVVVYFVGLTFALGADAARESLASPSQLLILQIITSLPVAGFLLVALPRVAKTNLAGLGFRAPTGCDVLYALAGAVLMAVAVDGAGSLIATLTHHQDTEQAVALLKQMKTPLQQAGFFVAACLVAPFFEELLFRVYIFNALTRYMPVGISIAISGIIFGTLHISGPEQLLTVAVPLALGGMILAYVYWKTKCFWVNVTTHAVFNSLGVLSYLFLHVN